jgi:hypothetical protein
VGQSITNPKRVYYDKLIAFIKSVDVHDFASELTRIQVNLGNQIIGPIGISADT